MFFPPGVGIFPTLFILVFIIVLATIIFRAAAGVTQWATNNRQPVLTVEATIVSKRMEVRRYSSNNNGQSLGSNVTTYFVTFQVESKDRFELKVHGSDYGLLVEGDLGSLTFQGTRFLGFVRA